MSRSKPEKIGNGGKCDLSVWTRAITANSEWPDKVNITALQLIVFCIYFHDFIHKRFLFTIGRIS